MQKNEHVSDPVIPNHDSGNHCLITPKSLHYGLNLELKAIFFHLFVTAFLKVSKHALDFLNVIKHLMQLYNHIFHSVDCHTIHQNLNYHLLVQSGHFLQILQFFFRPLR